MSSINTSLPYSQLQAASRLIERDRAKSEANENSVRPARPAAEDDGFETSASMKAIDRIIAIITGLNEAAEEPSVSEAGGSILSAEGTDRADTMTFDARNLYGLDAGDGDDQVIAKGLSLYALDAGAGNDSLKLAGAILGEVSGGDGDDRIDGKADLAIGIDGGAGDDRITLSGTALIGIAGGEGQDELRLEGDRITAAGGKGDDRFAIRNRTGATTLDYARGDGRDTISADGPLTIRFSGVNAYQSDTLDIATSGGDLVIKGEDGDSITVSLGGRTPTWSFGDDNGVLTLTIR